eukprot:maker-scaffold_23-snap-gene-2.5-mRNA-1 protein AED:0.03 eAED:0.08 QI:0/0/0.5/1/1/1/2/18/212
MNLTVVFEVHGNIYRIYRKLSICRYIIFNIMSKNWREKQKEAEKARKEALDYFNSSEKRKSELNHYGKQNSIFQIKDNTLNLLKQHRDTSSVQQQDYKKEVKEQTRKRKNLQEGTGLKEILSSSKKPQISLNKNWRFVKKKVGLDELEFDVYRHKSSGCAIVDPSVLLGDKISPDWSQSKGLIIPEGWKLIKAKNKIYFWHPIKNIVQWKCV